MRSKTHDNEADEPELQVFAEPNSYFNQKVMLLGDSGVGKTCLLVHFKDGKFLEGNFIATVGMDFRVRLISYFPNRPHLISCIH